jgi:hypothetical protein
MAVVIFSETNGIYLGNCMGLGFWTKLDPIGQTGAITFPDAAVAQSHMAEWEGGVPDDVQFVEVTAESDGYATMESCVRAGLPGWLVEDTPVANTLPA